jgi:hypothetical protein
MPNSAVKGAYSSLKKRNAGEGKGSLSWGLALSPLAGRARGLGADRRGGQISLQLSTGLDKFERG